jgi:hypothetical protein
MVFGGTLTNSFYFFFFLGGFMCKNLILNVPKKYFENKKPEEGSGKKSLKKIKRNKKIPRYLRN